MAHSPSVRGPEADDLPSASAALAVGAFRFWFIGEIWWWSDDLARMHGYEPGTVEPTTELLLSHKHPDDRQHVQDLLDYALHHGGSFSSRHRFLDTAARQHSVIVIADRMLDETAAVVGTKGYYIDLTDTFEQAHREAVSDELPEV